MVMSRKLPLGEQDFVKIRTTGCVYVDKTALIYSLLTSSGSQFFLSRPRRFGKSLLCSTLKALFEGEKELFAGLAVEKTDWEWKQYPVISLDLNAADYDHGLDKLDARLSGALTDIAESHDVHLRGASLPEQFAFLIKDLNLQSGQQVVVIIDEYDKPLLSTLENDALHHQMLSALKAFYGVLKSNDKYLCFVFLTGVTKFSHVSVFSDLNHLTDISLNPQYADLCGITQDELERNFGPEIDEVLANNRMERAEYLAKLKHYYNGYRFSDAPLTVYNSYGLLGHFYNRGKFIPYWFGRGTPTFLINLIKNQKLDISHIEDYTIRYSDFQKFDAGSMNAVTMLYQTGYLTIADYDEERNRFVLDYPNEEVRASFAESLVREYFQANENSLNMFTTKFVDAIFDADVDKLMQSLKVFLKGIPNTIIEDREKYFQAAVHLIFKMFGFDCRSEVALSDGRVDTLLETKKLLYLFEFKFEKSADEALKQIDTKDYLLPWKGSGKRMFKVGVNFSGEGRNIADWKWVEG
jgi:hypothetical protein